MTAKEYLSQAKRQDRRIGALLDRQRRYHELAGSCGENGRARMLELEKELDERIGAYAALVREIEGVIDAVGDAQYRDVLKYRYLNGWSWQRIAERMYFSQDWVWRLHARALKAVRVPE
ncbi:MAG: hypothetical protein IJ769_02340 [Clostridia bacterium]|nr:hypothetical protein [Clostridia bacterium]